MPLVGIDVGTTGCKAACFSEAGACLASAYREYRRGPHPHEIDPEEIVRSVFAVLSQLAAQTGGGIGAIAVSGFGESFVAVDAEYRPLHPAVLLTDPRGAGECEAFTARAGHGAVMRTAGLNPRPMYSAAKLMWLGNHKPELFGRIRRVFLIADWVLWRLGAEPCVDHATASRTMLFDVVGRRWDFALLSAAGLPQEWFSEPVAPGTAVGRLSPEAAGATGLPPGILLAAGSHDQIAASVGSGAGSPGRAVYGMGTSECVTPVFGRPVLDKGFLADNYACVPHAAPGCYATYAFNTSGGSLINWFRHAFARHLELNAAAAGESVFALLERGAAQRPSPVLALPHVAGTGTPDLDPRATGAFLGLTVETDLADLYRAVLEGVAFEMRFNLERLARYGVCPDALRAVGGGARSRLWLQIKADVLGLPVTSLEMDEAGTAGSAIFAGVALGVFGGVNDAAALFAREKETFTPDPAMRGHYAGRYAKYRAMRDYLLNQEAPC